MFVKEVFGAPSIVVPHFLGIDHLFFVLGVLPPDIPSSMIDRHAPVFESTDHTPHFVSTRDSFSKILPGVPRP